MTIEIRDLRDDELGFLCEMVYTAIAWRGDAESSPPELALGRCCSTAGR